MNNLNPITVHQPKLLEVGDGSTSQVGKWAIEQGYKRILVIASPITVPMADKLALNGKIAIFSEILNEPDEIALEAALKAARDHRPDLIVGLGGGSIMDIAKLVAVLWDSDQTIKQVIGPNKVRQKCSALALVATTAGTGSEAGIRSLITDSISKGKMAVESPFMLADMAILDPTLTYSIPSEITAATGVDAMAHCVEAFTNRHAHDMIDGYARSGIRLVGQYLRRAVKDGQDTEARTGMMLASYFGGICLGPVNTAAGHAIAYPLGTRIGLPHGLANALIFPHVLAFNASVCQSKTKEILQALKLPENTQSGAILDSTLTFCQSLGIKMRLSDHQAQQASLKGWAAEAHAIRRLMDNNPREMSVEDISEIYAAAF